MPIQRLRSDRSSLGRKHRTLTLGDQNSSIDANNMFRFRLEARLESRHRRNEVGTREADACRDRHLSTATRMNERMKHQLKRSYVLKWITGSP